MDGQSKVIQEKIRFRLEEVEQFISTDVPETSVYEKLRSEYMSLKEEAQSFKTLTQRIEEIQMQKQEAEELLSSLRSQRQSCSTKR